VRCCVNGSYATACNVPVAITHFELNKSSDTILEEDHPMTILSKFGSIQEDFYVNFPEAGFNAKTGQY
jgi:hypothetical protein